MARQSKNNPAQEEEYTDTGEQSASYSDAFYSQTAGRRYGYSPTNITDGPPEQNVQSVRTPGERRILTLMAIVCVVLCIVLVIVGWLLFWQTKNLHQAQAENDANANEAAEIYVEYSLIEEDETEEETEQVLSMADEAEDDTEQPLTAEEIYDNACLWTVGIAAGGTYDDAGLSIIGTGIVLTEDGYVLTNCHVIEDAGEGAQMYVLFSDGTEYTAWIAGMEEDSDLAVLKIDASGLTAAELGDSANMHVGQTVYTVGNPLGELSFTMTRGIVSSLDRSVTTDMNVTLNMFQFDASVNSGSSGGPVLNEYGRVVGVVTAKYSQDDAEGMGFAIPAEDAAEIANELIVNGYVSGKAYLGLETSTLNERQVSFYGLVPGVYVKSVEEGSCADRAGIQSGDVIVSVGGTEVSDRMDLTNALRDYNAGDIEVLTIYRNGNYMVVPVTFDEELPANYDTDANDEHIHSSDAPTGTASTDPAPASGTAPNASGEPGASGEPDSVG